MGWRVTMKLSDKILFLRKEKGYTQEELAELCNVSRQAITKWETDIAVPETDKIILLSKLFQVSIDVLLKDELLVSGVREVSTCGKSMIGEHQAAWYEGVLIKESISDENIIDVMEINKVELWKTNWKPKYWTVLYFTSKLYDFPERISKVMIGSDNSEENWFVDFKSGNIKYIVFKDLVLKYAIGNKEEKIQVCNKCSELGIPDEQMDWSE